MGYFKQLSNVHVFWDISNSYIGAVVVVIICIVGFTTTYAISAFHHQSCEFESHSWRGVLDATLCDNFFQWLATCWWFSPGTPVSTTSKTDHNITEKLLKVALNTITANPFNSYLNVKNKNTFSIVKGIFTCKMLF